MATNLPITFELADLPVGFQGDANQFGQQLFRNVSAYTQGNLLTGTIEGTQPTNEQGPWLHNRHWYYFDATSGVYLPEFTRSALPTQDEGPVLQDGQWMFWDATAGAYAVYVPQSIRNRNALVNGEPIWSQRGNAFTNVPDNTHIADRWRYDRSPTFTGQVNTAADKTADVPAGAYSARSPYCVRFSCVTAQPVLGGNDFALVTQRVERLHAFPLMGKPTALSLWLTSSQTGTYCASLRNSDFTQALVVECKLTQANQWTRFPFPNLPAMPTATGDWGTVLTDFAYQFTLALAAGGTFQSLPSQVGVWQTSNRVATTNQANFFSAVGNSLSFSLVQHEPGAACTPFESLSYDEVFRKCQRYYQKTCRPAIYPAAAANANPGLLGYFTNATFAVMTSRLPVPLRTAPTVAFFTHPTSGAVNSFNTTAGTFSGTSASGLTVWGFDSVTIPSSTNARGNVLTADAFYDAEV